MVCKNYFLKSGFRRLIIKLIMFELKNKSPHEQEFWNSLVFALTGWNLCDLENSKQKEILNNCRQFLLQYIKKFLDLKFGKLESDKIMNSVQNDIFGQTKKEEIKAIIDSFFAILDFGLSNKELELER